MSSIELLEQPLEKAPEGDSESIKNATESGKIRQKDLYAMGQESLQRAERESFAIWENMFLIGKDSFERFMINVYNNNELVTEFRKQAPENDEIADQIVEDLVTQMKTRFDGWKAGRKKERETFRNG